LSERSEAVNWSVIVENGAYESSVEGDENFTVIPVHREEDFGNIEGLEALGFWWH